MSALETRTFRADNLDAVLGAVREELGPEAIVIRQREGIIGGVGGFFGKRCVEVDVECPPVRAAAPKPSPIPARAATDAYTAVSARPVEPLVLEDFGGGDFTGDLSDDFSDDVGDLFQSLIGDNSIFGSALSDALEREEPKPTVTAKAAPVMNPLLRDPLLDDEITFEPRPEPTVESILAAMREQPVLPSRPSSFEMSAPVEASAPIERSAPSEAMEAFAPALTPPPIESSPVVPVAVANTSSATLALTSAGLDLRLAESIVAEADQQLRVFDPDEPFENHIRQVLAGRILTKRLTGRYRRRVIALVGAPGSGKTAAAARLCAAHVAAGKRVVAVSLAPVRETLELGRLTEDLEVELISADHIGLIEFALARMARAEVVIVDTPGVDTRDEAGWARLQMLLRPIAAHETHLLLPGGLDATGIDAQLGAASEKLRIDRLLISHLDDLASPGAAVAASIRAGIPISATATSGRLIPADPHRLATRIVS